MDKLLPCPFCGLPPYTIEQTGIIICQTPDCPKVEALTPEEWNRRAPGEAPAPAIEPHVPRGYMEEKDCRECGKPMNDPVHIGIGSPGEAPAPTPDEPTFEDAPPRNIVGTVRARFREVPNRIPTDDHEAAPTPEALDLEALRILDEMGQRLLRVVESLQEQSMEAEVDAGWCLNRIDSLVKTIRRLRSLPPSEGAGELERLRGRLKAEREASGFLLTAGNGLANMAYNGCQSDEIPTRYRDAMRDGYKAWDAARAKFRAAQPSKRAGAQLEGKG